MSVEAQATTTVNPNAGEFMDYVIVNNTNEGFPKPVINIKSDVKVITNNKSELTTPLGKATGKISTDQKGNVATTKGLEVNTRLGAVGTEVKKSQDGVTIKGTISGSIGNTKAKGSIIYDNQKSSTGAGIEMKAEQKAGQLKFSIWDRLIYRLKKQ